MLSFLTNLFHSHRNERRERTYESNYPTPIPDARQILEHHTAMQEYARQASLIKLQNFAGKIRHALPKNIKETKFDKNGTMSLAFLVWDLVIDNLFLESFPWNTEISKEKMPACFESLIKSLEEANWTFISARLQEGGEDSLLLITIAPSAG